MKWRDAEIGDSLKPVITESAKNPPGIFISSVSSPLSHWNKPQSTEVILERKGW